MNNSLTNFSTDPNSPNYGEKHKAPRSYTSPTIIVGPDFYMGIGSPGGNKIPTILKRKWDVTRIYLSHVFNDWNNLL